VARTLSTAEAARILGMREARIRELVRGGLCRPARRGRRYALSFQDLVVLRAARDLLAQQVPVARVRRALAALRAELPDDRPLSGLRVVADGRHVAVCAGGAAWQPETGQRLLGLGAGFEVDALAARVAALEHGELRPSTAGPGADGAGAGAEDAPQPAGRAAEAAGHFRTGLELDGEDDVAAIAAYRRAVALDPGLVDAWVNLGRLVHEGGDAREAARLYREALARAPEDPVVHFNLALALEDVKGAEAAAAHYERALELDPGFADAHYNLAGLYEQLGRGRDALRHYRAYKHLTDGGGDVL
jgi:tetratricopeptide (TPR) repeat protein